jgi:hypothetical protein
VADDREEGVSALKRLAIAIALMGAIPALAEDAPTKTIRTATAFGNDPCPAAREGEIIVCGRLPESERYRIPKQFREKPRDESGPSASWASKVQTLEAAQRFTMPNSCSVVGTGGQTGCTQAMLRQWFLDRQAIRQNAP